MKKICLFLATALMALSLAACGGDNVSGIYTDTMTGLTSYVLKDGQISTLMSMPGMEGMTIPGGPYEVKGGKLYVTGTQIGEIKGDTLTVSGVEYKKR